MAQGRDAVLPSKDEAILLLEHAGCSASVVSHCLAVAEYAGDIAERINSCSRKHGIRVDMELVVAGALLHDIGRARTHGIRHAVEGVAIARGIGLDGRLVRIIERHIGAGIDRDEASRLALPPGDYMPHSIEEKIVAHADNLLSGSGRITIQEEVMHLREKGLDEKLIERFIHLNDEIEGLMTCD